MSRHGVEVVRINEIHLHPNADRLEIVKIRGWTCCIQKGQFKVGDLAAYIEPDSIVPETRQFAFLGEHRRIKVKKLRGIVSQGLLIPAPEGSKEGDDVMDMLGIAHYEPPEPMLTGGETENSPTGYHPGYDVEHFNRYPNLFVDGEDIIITEKLHGSCGRFCWIEGRMYAGSRNEWKKERDDIIWWKVIKKYPELTEFCRQYPDITVYGEVYGSVQDLKYGHDKGRISFAIFDLLRNDWWINGITAREIGKNLPWVPIVDITGFSESKVRGLADGPSLVPGTNNIREGIVIKPTIERNCPEIGRVQLKLVSNQYLERS